MVLNTSSASELLYELDIDKKSFNRANQLRGSNLLSRNMAK